MHFDIALSFPKKVTCNETVNPANARIPLPKAGKEQTMECLFNLEILKPGMAELLLEVALVSANDCLNWLFGMDGVLETLEKGILLRGLGEIKGNSAYLQFPERYWKSYQTIVEVEKRKDITTNIDLTETNFKTPELASLTEEALVATGRTVDILSWLQQGSLSSPKWHFQTKSRRILSLIQGIWCSLAAFFPFSSSPACGNQYSYPHQHWNTFFLTGEQGTLFLRRCHKISVFAAQSWEYSDRNLATTGISTMEKYKIEQ